MVVMTVSQLLSSSAILHACLKAFLLDSEPSTATSILLYLPMTLLQCEEGGLCLLLHLCLFHAESESVEHVEYGIAPPHRIGHVEHEETGQHSCMVHDLLAFDLVKVIGRLYRLFHHVGDHLCLFDLLFLLEFLHDLAQGIVPLPE